MTRPSVRSRLPAQEAGELPVQRPYRWVVNAAVPMAFSIIAAVIVFLPPAMDTGARIVLFVFSLAVIFWTATGFNGAYVALAAVVSLVLSGVTPQESLFIALGSDVIWLMIGAFILGAAIQQTGLAGRLVSFVASRARTVKGVFWLLTTVLIPMALVIPSTSGRAAIAMPVFHSMAAQANDRRITRALAILIPTVILTSTISTIIAAGSHLVAVDLLEEIAGVRISYAEWLLYGLPFGVISSYLSAWVVQYLFLDKEQRLRALPRPQQTKLSLSLAEAKALSVVLLMVCLWLSEHWHGLEIATVTVVGALLLTLPGVGVLKWKSAVKAVSWNLIIFVGAATVLGKTLIDTGAAYWIIEHLIVASGILTTNDSFLILLFLSLISLTSHIYITSHTARAAALVSPLLFLAMSQEWNPLAVLFVGIVGMDYCQTFPVSSKALLMFYELEEETYRAPDLLKLSAVLLCVHLILMIAFYFGYWRWVGLAF